MTDRLRVLIVVGYFDWFSGYQETALAAALSSMADTEVLSSNFVNPTFSDTQLNSLGMERRYNTGSVTENGVRVTRFATYQWRSIVWSNMVRRYLGSRSYDLIIQVMPGQGLPIAASLTRRPGRRVALYGDNRAMWQNAGTVAPILKGVAFTLSKGLAYTLVNARATKLYGYTPNTQRRLRMFSAGKKMEVMPLAYDPRRFFRDEAAGVTTRAALKFDTEDIVIVSAGKFEGRKRLDWLVQAFSAAARGNPALRLLLVGDDGSKSAEELKTVIRQSAVADRITVQGFCAGDELNALFNAADLGIWPKDPAITIQQAMGTGLPVILPSNDLVGHLLHGPGQPGLSYSLRAGRETVAIGTALTDAVRMLDLSRCGRRLRAIANRRLSANTLAQKLLAESLSSGCSAIARRASS